MSGESYLRTTGCGPFPLPGEHRRIKEAERRARGVFAAADEIHRRSEEVRAMSDWGTWPGRELFPGENWQPGDIVADAEGQLWTRCSRYYWDQGWPWHESADHLVAPTREGNLPGGPEGAREEEAPVRPLTLVARNGKLVRG